MNKTKLIGHLLAGAAVLCSSLEFASIAILYRSDSLDLGLAILYVILLAGGAWALLDESYKLYQKALCEDYIEKDKKLQLEYLVLDDFKNELLDREKNLEGFRMRLRCDAALREEKEKFAAEIGCKLE